MRCLVLLLLALLLTGCPATATTAPLVPPSTPPDPSMVVFLTGVWDGISTTDRGVQDYLTFEFYPQAEYLRVRVLLNDDPLAEPYADVVGDQLTIDAADTSGNSGLFGGTIDMEDARISGSFTLRFNGLDDSGTYELMKISG